MIATTNSPTPKTEESEVSKQSSNSSDFFFQQKHVSHRVSNVDKLNDLNRAVIKRPAHFSVRPTEPKIDEMPLFLDFSVPSQPHKSIIKKNSIIKSSHEIELLREKQAEGKLKKGKKVQFEDLLYVEDIDEHIRNEELNYSKLTKLAPKKKKHAANDDLAKADGLDRSQILAKRRRSERDPEEADESSSEIWS